MGNRKSNRETPRHAVRVNWTNAEGESSVIVIRQKILSLSVILSIVTLGIYLIYWDYHLIKNTRAIKNQETGGAAELLLRIFIPFYSWYWWFTRGKSIKKELQERGYHTVGNSVAYLILAIFGLVIIPSALMQLDFNTLASADIKTVSQSSYQKQERLSFMLFLSEVPNFIIVVALAITSKSLVVFMDLIDSTGNLLRALFMFLLSHKLRKDLRYEYNYGVGKVEALSSLCCDCLLLFSIASMFFFAVQDIITPQQPSETLGFAVIFKFFCVAGDAYMFFRQRKICVDNKDNLVFKSELSMRIKNLAFDSTTLIAIFLIYILRDFRPAWYFSPVVCILLAIYLTVGIIIRIRQAIREMLDKTADENVQKTVLQALTANYDAYDSFESVHSHVSGGTVYIDLGLKFRDETPYSEICVFVDRIYDAVKQKISDCRVSVQIVNTPDQPEEDISVLPITPAPVEKITAPVTPVPDTVAPEQ